MTFLISCPDDNQPPALHLPVTLSKKKADYEINSIRKTRSTAKAGSAYGDLRNSGGYEPERLRSGPY